MWKLCNRPYSSGIPKPKPGKIKSSDSEHKLKNKKKKTSKLITDNSKTHEELLQGNILLFKKKLF